MDERTRRMLEAVRQARITLDRADRNLRSEMAVAFISGATQREVQAACGWSMMKTRAVMHDAGIEYGRGKYRSSEEDA